jgi:hypothetical protein
MSWVQVNVGILVLLIKFLWLKNKELLLIGTKKAARLGSLVSFLARFISVSCDFSLA